jgi:hypothetical protein
MAKANCVGCGAATFPASREHVLPQWLAKEVFIPKATLNHYLRDEDENKDELLRKHGLNNFAVKNVCKACNNGWMGLLEDRAKPFILELMNEKTKILNGLPPEGMLAVSRWAAKTAFMIASVQKEHCELPWQLFQSMKSDEDRGPDGCFVFAGQVLAMSKGFTYACIRDHRPHDEKAVVNLRIGFSIKRIHLVVVIPLVEGERVLKTDARIHTALWPIGLRTMPQFAHPPARFTSLARAQYFLTNLIEAGLVQRG